MLLKVFAIRDRQQNAFMQPFFNVSVGAAVRAFTDEVNRAAEDNVLYRHPEDFELYLISEYNGATAEFDSMHVEQVCVAANVAVRVDTSST